MTLDTILEMNASMRDWDVPPLGPNPMYRYSVIAVKWADVLARVVYGDKLQHLAVEDRDWLMGQAETAIKDALLHYNLLRIEARGKGLLDESDAMNRWRKRDEAL